MDERQSQIKEGAGLEESRINTDLIDFLNKWSGPFLLVLALIVGAMWAKRYFDDQARDRVDRAFAEYTLAISGTNPSPSSLGLIADEYSDVRAVPLLARMDRGDIFMRAVRTGIAPGAEIDPGTGDLVNPEDELDDESRASYLASAAAAYTTVLDDATKDGRALLAVNAAFGLAAAVASGTEADARDLARAEYERAASIAEEASYPMLARIARERAGVIGDVTEPVIYAAADVPDLPAEDDPALDSIFNTPDPGAPGIEIDPSIPTIGPDPAAGVQEPAAAEDPEQGEDPVADDPAGVDEAGADQDAAATGEPEPVDPPAEEAGEDPSPPTQP